MEARDLLIGLSLKNQGDWEGVMNGIAHHDSNFEGKERLIPLQTCLTYCDDDYPEELKKFPQPPFVLYYMGDIKLLTQLPAESRITISSSRSTDEYSEGDIYQIIKNIPEQYVIVCSGSLGGVTSALTAAITLKRKIIIILGCSLDNCQPKSNLDLFDEVIKSGGLIITEYPNGTAPAINSGMQRNRLLAFLSSKILFIEVGEHSSQLLTLHWALNYSRDVFVCPVKIGTKLLNNNLIAEGAQIYTGPECLEDLS